MGSKTELLTPEPLGAIKSRLKLISIYVLYLVVIGLPMWFYTTSIYQTDLPIQDIKLLESTTSLSYDIPVYIKLPKLLRYLTSQTQQLIDEELVKLGVDINEYHLSLQAYPTNKVITEDEYEVILEPHENETESIYVNPFGKSVKVLFSDDVVAHGKIPDFIMKVLIYDIFQEEIKFHQGNYSDNNLALPYSGHYNLVFSLVVENGESINWEIEKAINEYFQNFINQLSSFTNFTIDTQIQYYCDFDDSNLHIAEGSRILNSVDLSTFVDFGGWNLDNLISIKPTINFLLYIPGTRFLQIENSKTNSFIIPQWGGVKILNTESSNISTNELLPIFEIFSSQLLTLLNFPKTPKSLLIRLDIIKRITILQNFKETFHVLNSLIKLIQQLLDIPIPKATLRHIEEALILVKELTNINNDDDAKLIITNKMIKASNDAFFQKDMIQQNYFPQAHKFTIYLPIVGPFLLILVSSSMSTIADYKRRKNMIKES